MKKIFLDTNFIVDYFIRDDYRAISETLMSSADKDGSKFYISYLSVANFAYIARKTAKDKLMNYLLLILELFEIVPNNASQISKAIKLEASDFEDALQYEAALEAGCDCIITRNARDFSFSSLPVYSATEYVQQYLSNI